eukprot:11053662-Alexandrium_andersonii.AAC.1
MRSSFHEPLGGMAAEALAWGKVRVHLESTEVEEVRCGGRPWRCPLVPSPVQRKWPKGSESKKGVRPPEGPPAACKLAVVQRLEEASSNGGTDLAISVVRVVLVQQVDAGVHERVPSLIPFGGSKR